MGETLSVDTSGISDADGIANSTPTYQWIANDGTEDTDIQDATGSTYTVGAADEGKTIKVRVSFTDDAGNDESLTSEATAAVAARPNSAATGAPTISGTAQVGQMLTASTSGISDSDGLADAIFTYQWIANDGTEDTDIQDATGSTYTLASADEGKTIKVRVSFTDDGGNQETRTSAVTVAVAAAPTPLTAATHDAPGSHNGQEKFTFELRFSEELGTGFSYKTLRDYAFTVTRGTVAGARRLDSDSDTPNIRWEISVTPDSTADVTVELPITTDCDAQGAICTADGTMLSSPLKFTVKGPPLTASFESVPTSHNGSDSFRIRIAFSEAQIGLQLHHDARPRLHGDRRHGNRRAAAGQRQQHPLGGHRRTGLKDRDDHPARHHGLRRAGGHLRRRRREAVQPPGAHRQRAWAVMDNEKSKHRWTGEAGGSVRGLDSRAMSHTGMGSLPSHRRGPTAMLWERLRHASTAHTLQQKNLRRSRRLPAAAEAVQRGARPVVVGDFPPSRDLPHTVWRWWKAGVRPGQHHLKALLWPTTWAWAWATCSPSEAA